LRAIEWAIAVLIAVAAVSASHAGDLPATGQSPTGLVARIGRLMFFDPSLSASGKLACATCHDPRYAYGPPPGKALAYGGKDMRQPGTRAVPSLRYLNGMPAFAEQHHFVDGDVGPVGGFTWDGRAGSLHEQAVVPLLAANEMANRDAAEVVRKLEKSAYAGMFRTAFGADVFKDGERAFAAGLAALEAFQQDPAEFYPYSSKYDAYLRGDVELTDQEERGVALFKDPAKGNCASCHLGLTRGGRPPVFTDYDFANVGVPRNGRIPANRDPAYFDLGLCGPARRDLLDKREYCGFFRSPTVRNVALRDAFFHNGVFTSLREVMHFYVQRDLHPEQFYPRNPDGSVHKYDDMPPGYPVNIDRDAPLDRAPGAAPALTEAEIDDVIAFLATLTDGYVAPGTPATARSDVSAARAGALDWRRPWLEPRDPVAARERSDEYAWALFVALNWPADAGSRGADRPVVWESWQNSRAVYRADGADPGAWEPGVRHPADARRAPDQPRATSERFETVSLKDLPNARHVVHGVMVPWVDPVESAQRLTEIRMNRAAYQYIRARGLYSIDGQRRAVMDGGGVHFPYGAKEVKAKWRPITSAERSRYHTLVVTLADGTTRLYGLTALHIASKDLPNWFWATFEHVDNPSLADSDHWQLASHDEFACRGESADCNQAPRGIGLDGTVWQYYRLRGTLTSFVDADGVARRLANSELENGFQTSASCITCHARASIAVSPRATAARLDESRSEALRLPIFDGPDRRGFLGLPQPAWFAPGGESNPHFMPLDFVWSLSKAHWRSESRRVDGMVQ